MTALDDSYPMPVPQWQEEVLDERETQVAEGKAKYIDWEVAKREI